MCGLTALWRCHLTRSGLEFSITFSLQLVPKQNARNVRALSIYFGVLQFQAFGAFSSVSVHCSTHVPVSQFHQNMVPQSLALCNSIPSSKQIQKRAGDQVYFKVFQDFAKTKLRLDVETGSHCSSGSFRRTVAFSGWVPGPEAKCKESRLRTSSCPRMR